MSLVAWYKLDNNASDSIGSNDGTVTNVTYTTGKIGACGAFNGSSSYVSLSNPLKEGQSFSIGFWGKVNTVAQHCFGCSRTVAGYGVSIFILSNALRFDTGSGSYEWGTSYNMPINTWVHVVVTKDNNYKKLYINGEFHSSTSSVGDMATLSSLYTIGASHANGAGFNNYLNGNVDDYRIYDHALSPKEVKELSKAKLLHYKFDDFQEPTTNLIPSSLNTDITNWLSAYHVQNGTKEYLDGTVVKNWDVSDEAYVCIDLDTALFTNGDPTTASIYIYCNQNYTFPIRWNLTTSLIPVTAFTWTRLVLTKIYDTSVLYPNRLLIGYRNADSAADPPAGLQVAYALAQVEKKDHATPFVNGSHTGTVMDCSGYENHAVLDTYAPQWTTDGKIGSGCYKFNGSSQYISTSIPVYIPAASDYTQSLWFYATLSGNRQVLIDDNNRWEHWVCIDSGLTMSAFYYNGAQYGVTSTNTIQLNKWYHVCAVVVSGVSMKLYVNGELWGENNTIGGIQSKTYNDVVIGCAGNDHPGKFTGSIDDVRIYATALSSDDIKELYQQRASIDDHGNLYVGQVEQHMNWDEEYKASNLVVNGSAETGDSYNFSGFTYYTSDYYTSPGCFSRIGPTTMLSTEYIKVDKDCTYNQVGYLKSIGSGGLSRVYFGVSCYDKNKSSISHDMVHHYTNTRTTLAADLVNGATTVELTSSANWIVGTGGTTAYNKKIVFWKSDNEYPVYTYSRAEAYYLTLSSNTITLQTAWNGGAIPAGTPVANCYDGSGYNYMSAAGVLVPTAWTKYTGNITGWGINQGENVFRYGTEYVKIMFLVNYAQDSTYQLLVDRLVFYNNTRSQTIPVETQLSESGTFKAIDYSEVGITDNLVGWWPLNKDADDISGNGNRGTVTGAVLAYGLNGMAYSFDGTDDKITFLSDGLGDTITALTISCWVNGTANSGEYTYIVHRGITTSIGDSAYYIGVNNIGMITAAINGLYSAGATSIALASGVWYHISLVWDGTTAYVYVNGSFQVQYAVSLTNTTIGSYLCLGDSYNICATRNYVGKLQDVRIYNRALSSEEVATLYETTGPDKKVKFATDGTIYTTGELKEA